MIKTYITSFDPESLANPKLIWKGSLPSFIVKGMEIDVNGSGLEKVERVSYSIPNNLMEIILETTDRYRNYETVEL
jgi:hypothetical protein